MCPRGRIGVDAMRAGYLGRRPRLLEARRSARVWTIMQSAKAGLQHALEPRQYSEWLVLSVCLQRNLPRRLAWQDAIEQHHIDRSGH